MSSQECLLFDSQTETRLATFCINTDRRLPFLFDYADYRQK